MRDRTLGARVDLLRFGLIVGLVFLHYGPLPGSDHSPFVGVTPAHSSPAEALNSFVLFLFLTAVPLLSAISGWLFFKGHVWSRAFYLDKWRKRARSILLPMVLWNGAILLAFVTLARIDPASHWLEIVDYDVANLAPFDVVNALLGVTRHPIDFQFWFLSDLLLTIVLAPLIAWALLRAPWLSLAVLSVVWLSGSNLWIFFRTDVLFFFTLGAFLRLHGRALPEARPEVAIALVALFLGLTALRTAAPLAVDLTDPVAAELVDIATRLLRLVGVAAIWVASPLAVGTSVGQFLARFGPVAFFLHAAHWPLNQVVKTTLARALPSGDLGLIVNYVATGLLTVAIVLAVAVALSTVAPRLYAILAGGREGLFQERRMREREVAAARD